MYIYYVFQMEPGTEATNYHKVAVIKTLQQANGQIFTYTYYFSFKQSAFGILNKAVFGIWVLRVTNLSLALVT